MVERGEQAEATAPSARERRAFWVVWLVLAAASIVPIWITRFLPLVDDPNHLSAVYIWHGLADPHSSLHRFYEPRVAPVSYFLHYFIAYAAAWLVGVEAGHKLALCVYVLGVPLAAALWCRRTGRSPWLSVLAFPLPYSFLWAFGFHPFNLGLAMMLLAVVAFDALFEQVRWQRLWMATALCTLCYLGHPIPLAMLGMAVPVLLVASGVTWRKLVAAAAGFAPAFLLLRWQAARTSKTPIDWRKVSGGHVLTFDRQEWLTRLDQFDDLVMNVVSGPLDTQLFRALLLCSVVMLLAALVRRRPAVEPRSPWASCRLLLYRYRSLALAAVMFAGYLTLPLHFGEPSPILIVSGRLAPAAFYFLLLSAAISARDVRRWLALTGVVISLVMAVHITGKYRKFARYMQPLPALVARCPADSDLLTANLEPHAFPQTTDMDPFRLLPAWVQVLHGGFAPDYWVRPIPFPFAVKRTMPTPTWLAPTPRPEHLAAAQCVVGHYLQQRPRGFKLIERVGDWSLYIRRKPRGPDAEPLDAGPETHP